MLPRCIEDLSRFVVKYPFTKEAKKILLRYELYLEDLTSDIYKPIVNRALQILKDALVQGKIIDNFDNYEVEVVAHYLATIFASFLNERLWRRFADVESKRFSSYLKLEDMSCVIYIAKEFGINVTDVRSVVGTCNLIQYFDVAVPVWTYLKYCPKNDPYWKLTNRYLVKGFVLLQRDELIRLIEQLIENQLIDLMKKIKEQREDLERKIEAILPKIKEIEVDVLKKLYGRKTIPEIVSSESGKYVEEFSVENLFPPCIQKIIDEIRSGGNPSHHARFTVASFLLHVYIEYEKLSVEEAVEKVVELFRNVADFDEKKTRYQVEHIAGLRGGRKFYLPPNCDELNSLGLCPNNLACGVKNPLAYYSRMIRKLKRKEKSTQGLEHAQ